MRNDAIPGADRVRGPAVRFGLMRAAAASPAMFGSMLLVLVAGGGPGAWALVVALTWACCGAVLLTPGGERAAVRAAFGFRRPNSEPAAVLQPLWSAALRLAGASVDDVELYVQRAWQLNAYATGGRSVAVTSRVLDDHRAGRLSGDQVVAVLVHELGHHATGATRPTLLAMWLAAPYRAAARLLSGTGRALCGRQSRRDFTVMGIPVMGVAVVRAVYQGHWLAGGVAAGIALCAVVCPLADAWTCRRAEFAADRFAADHGCARELADALRALHGPPSTTAGWSRRLLATHPTANERVSALLAVPSGSWVPSQRPSGCSAHSCSGQCPGLV
jgi:STE24 endopeptidase